MEEYNKMISGQEHDPQSEYLNELRNITRAKLVDFNIEKDDARRSVMIKSILRKAGRGCFITPPFFCDYGINTELGNNVYFNANCTILDSAVVKIGSNTMIGPNVQFYTPIHPLEYRARNKGLEKAKPITVGRNCWLGGGVIILPGVTIGEGCVIGAGSVVTKDIPDNSLAVGNPARVIKNIDNKKI